MHTRNAYIRANSPWFRDREFRGCISQGNCVSRGTCGCRVDLWKRKKQQPFVETTLVRLGSREERHSQAVSVRCVWFLIVEDWGRTEGVAVNPLNRTLHFWSYSSCLFDDSKRGLALRRYSPRPPDFFSLSPCLRLFVATLSSDTPQLKGIRALTSATRFSRTRIICLSSIPLSLPDNLSSSSSSVRVAEENSRSLHLERTNIFYYTVLFIWFFYIIYMPATPSPRNYSNTCRKLLRVRCVCYTYEKFWNFTDIIDIVTRHQSRNCIDKIWNKSKNVYHVSIDLIWNVIISFWLSSTRLIYYNVV